MRGDEFAELVTEGEVREAVFCGESGAEGAFARAGGSEDED